MAANDPYCRRPEPTHLILLDQIHVQPPGRKIRVLGCVHEYKIETATLVLKGEYDFTPNAPQHLIIFAGIHNVLESIKSDLLQVGAWVNIVGYVKPPTHVHVAAPSRKRRKSSKMLSIPTLEVLLIWSAGAIKLTDYQSAVRSFQSTHIPAG
jgi:hypothetical protein